MEPKRNSAGGKATAIKLRNQALDSYYIDPQICKNCKNVIEVKDEEKVSTVKRKVFCNRSCSAQYNNSISPKRKKKIKEPKIKKEDLDILGQLTKSDLMNKHNGIYSNWRSSICKHARKIFRKYGGDKKCIICQYSNHIDVAHINSVSSFEDNVKVEIINSIENLIPLCPNHHWEFDNGILSIDTILDNKNKMAG